MHIDPALRSAIREDGFVALDHSHQRILAAVDRLESCIAACQDGELGPASRAAVLADLAFLSGEVADHHRTEERLVFPSLVAVGNAEIAQAVLRLRQDHGWLEEDWRELMPQLQAIAGGYGGCDLDALRSGIAVYAALLHDHIALEETLVYPQAQAHLGKAGRRGLGRELAAAWRRR